MNRNEFLSLASLSVASIFLNRGITIAGEISKNQIKPQKLKTGDIVGIISPGTAVSSPDDLVKVEEILNYLGLKFKYASNVFKGSGYKTRTVGERVDDLHEMFSDKDVKAIFCTRGGYGSGRLLDKIDYDLIRANPKIFVGYSDITALHIAINKLTGLTTFHGPVLLSSFNNYSTSYFKKIIFAEAEYPFILRNPQQGNLPRNSFSTRVIVGGQAEGVTLVANLTLLISLLGTPYAPDFAGKLLLIEDVGEPPYKIDRMLNQLRMAGVLDAVNGIVFGRCDDCNSGSSQSTWDLSLGEVLDSYFKALKIPIFYGLTFGHTDNQLTIPQLCRASINADDGTLSINESPVS